MSKLLLAYVLGTLLLIQSPPSNNQKQEPSEHKENITKPSPSPVPVPSVIAKENCGSCQQQAGTDSNAGNWHDWFWPPEWSNWFLFGGAIWAGCIGLKTLRSINAQTKATLASARATQKTADAMVNAERPWIIPILERSKVRQQIGDQRDRYNHPITEEHTQFRFSLKNHGRTPALVTSVIVRNVFIDSLYDLPPVPDYTPESDFDQQRILSQNDEPMHLDGWLFRAEWVLRPRGIEEEVMSGDKFWWNYGRVVYRNVLDGTEHETRFCRLFIRDRKDLIIAGPPEYTKYT